MNTFRPVSVTRLYRIIADQIAARIRAGDFLPGDRLPSERDLVDQLQVSRPSIREALIALEIEGYVEVRVGTGVYVASANPEKSRTLGMESGTQLGEVGPFDLMAARILIEPESAALAAQNATRQQIATICRIAEEMKTAEQPEVCDRQFHIAIAEASGNLVLLSTISHLHNLREGSTVLTRLEKHFVNNKVWQVVEVEHDRIVQAIRKGDPVAAREAMHQHMTAILQRLREDFGSGNDVWNV